MFKKISFYFHVKKRTLLLMAGFVWLAAGINVARLGILSYLKLVDISWALPLLSIVIFILFGMMFFRMSMKHTNRIHGLLQETMPIWHFFDLKSYIIMAFMMGGGIWLRSSGLAPNWFIAFFYTGLGAALALAGVFFIIKFATFPQNSQITPSN